MRRSLLLALLVLGAFPGTAFSRPVVVELVARDDARPEGLTFRGSGCDSVPRYTFRFPRGARSPRLDEMFKPGLELGGPAAPGFGNEGSGEPFISPYARLVRVERRRSRGRTVFDLDAKAEPANCAGYTDPRNGAFVPGWVALPLQVFGTYRRRVSGLYTVDAVGTRRDGPPQRFAITRGRVATGLRWRRWATQDAVARGRVGGQPVTVEAYNPEYCRKRVFYENYLVEIGRQRNIFDLSADCRRLVPQR